ncbi:MAG: hypothetical protein Q9195_000106 [Heterodermia aff. obscurata]
MSEQSDADKPLSSAPGLANNSYHTLSLVAILPSLARQIQFRVEKHDKTFRSFVSFVVCKEISPKNKAVMASAGAWGAIPQSEELVHNAAEAIEKVRTNDRSDEADPASTESSGTEYDKERADDEVTRLARQVTLHSIQSTGGTYANPFEGPDDPALDPNSGQFKPEIWVRTLMGLKSRDPERYPERVAGVSYRNLNVHGFGSLTDYQKTFGNYPLEIAGLFNKLTGRGKRKIQILRNFEGLVKSGEMLVVLGRPGSGCSTLLKTIAGETSGFYIDEGMFLNDV